MALPKVENLQITRVSDNVLSIHQINTPFHFSCCDGLLILPKPERNNSVIALDLNIEPEYVNKINKLFGPLSNYICSHGHMDHIAHVHAWEKAGATIYGPEPEARNLTHLFQFFKIYDWDEFVDFDIIKQLGALNKYQKCSSKIKYFNPGDQLQFENAQIKTIPFTGHSLSHVGFFLEDEKVFHISCLGFDKQTPDSEGWGPWYGFKQCSITQYLKDIDYAESFFLQNAKYLTSSHAYIVKNPDSHPFSYMRKKIHQNQTKIDEALKILIRKKNSDDQEGLIKNLLKQDLFFPKKKMRGFLVEVYTVWEYWLIRKHLERSEFLNST